MTEKPTKVLEEGDDFVEQTYFATTKQTLVVLTRNGKAYPLDIGDIPKPLVRLQKGSRW